MLQSAARHDVQVVVSAALIISCMELRGPLWPLWAAVKELAVAWLGGGFWNMRYSEPTNFRALHRLTSVMLC